MSEPEKSQMGLNKVPDVHMLNWALDIFELQYAGGFINSLQILPASHLNCILLLTHHFAVPSF